MKIVFYKTLLTEYSELTPTEKIVYSFLVSKSVTNLGSDFFSSDGTAIDNDALYESLCDGAYIPIYEISIRKMAKTLNIVNQTVITSIRRLENEKLIVAGNIFVDSSLLKNGYFELHRNDILTGQVLIFYSFIRSKSQLYDGCIDTYKRQLGEIMGIKVYSVQQYLSKLYKLGLIERLENGKLKIYGTKKEI